MCCVCAYAWVCLEFREEEGGGYVQSILLFIFLKGGRQADLFWNNGIEMTIGQRSTMVTQSFKAILGPLSHLSANLGLDRIWGLKNRFF